MKYYNLTVGVIQSREEYIDKALSSITRAAEAYPGKVELILINNKDKQRSIGSCFNEIADKANYEWVLYIGDDDAITVDYIVSCMVSLESCLNDGLDICGMKTMLTLFDSSRQKRADLMPQGIISRDVVRKYRYDENMPHGVDSEFDRRINAAGLTAGVMQYHYGYFYRQHDNNVSGNKFKRVQNENQV